jgi:hypothetical protein
MTRTNNTTEGRTMKAEKLIAKGRDAECKGKIEKAANLYRQAQDASRPLSPEWTVARNNARRLEGA